MGLVFFILLSLGVFADEQIDVSITPVRDEIVLGADAVFRLTIENNQGYLDSFRITTLTSGWGIDEASRRINVKGNQSERLNLTIRPTTYKDLKTHAVDVSVISSSDASVRVEKLLNVKIVDIKDVLDLDVGFPEIFSEGSQAKVTFTNNKDYSLSDLLVKIDSDYFFGQKMVSIAPGENIEYVNINFSDEIEIGEYNTKIKLIYGDEVIYEIEEDVDLNYFSEENQILSPESEFLLSRTRLIKMNDGDTVVHDTYSHKVNWFEKLLTYSNIEPTEVVAEGGNYVLSWDFDVDPGETFELVVTTNYRWFALIVLVVLVLIVLLYNYFRSDLSLEKKVLGVKHMEDGVSVINVVITLKNKSFKEIKNIKITDTIYKNLDEPYFGGLKPDINRKVEGRQTIMWNIPGLPGRGEISMAYSVKMKLRFVDDFSLPRAFAKYSRKGRAITLGSNFVKLFGY